MQVEKMPFGIEQINNSINNVKNLINSLPKDSIEFIDAEKILANLEKRKAELQ